MSWTGLEVYYTPGRKYTLQTTISLLIRKIEIKFSKKLQICIYPLIIKNKQNQANIFPKYKGEKF